MHEPSKLFIHILINDCLIYKFFRGLIDFSVLIITLSDIFFIWYTIGETLEFEEGVSYLVKNHTLSNKYGKPSKFVKSATCKCKTAPLSLTEDQERKAKEILVAHSLLVSVDPSEAGHVSLLGEIEAVSTFNRGISCVIIQCCHLVRSSFS